MTLNGLLCGKGLGLYGEVLGIVRTVMKAF